MSDRQQRPLQHPYFSSTGCVWPMNDGGTCDAPPAAHFDAPKPAPAEVPAECEFCGGVPRRGEVPAEEFGPGLAHCSGCGVILHCDGTDKEHASAARQRITALEAALQQARDDHHALGRWPDCPHCVKVVNEDLEGAHLNAELRERLEQAQQALQSKGQKR